MDQDRLPAQSGGAWGTLQVVRERVRQIAADNGAELWQVVFIVGQQNDDLSVYMDPDYYSKWSVISTALLPGGRLRKVSTEVERLLVDIRSFGLADDLGSWQSGRCARCSPGLPSEG